MIQELITEIKERNRLRREAGLPLLSVAEEVRKVFEAQRARGFERFVETSPLRKQIEDELLARQRLARHDPEWKPTGMLSGGGWAFYLEVRRLLRRHHSA